MERLEILWMMLTDKHYGENEGRSKWKNSDENIGG